MFPDELSVLAFLRLFHWVNSFLNILSLLHYWVVLWLIVGLSGQELAVLKDCAKKYLKNAYPILSLWLCLLNYWVTLNILRLIVGLIRQELAVLKDRAKKYLKNVYPILDPAQDMVASTPTTPGRISDTAADTVSCQI